MVSCDPMFNFDLNFCAPELDQNKRDLQKLCFAVSVTDRGLILRVTQDSPEISVILMDQRGWALVSSPEHVFESLTGLLMNVSAEFAERWYAYQLERIQELAGGASESEEEEQENRIE